MNIFKLVLESDAKVNIAAIGNGSINLTVVNSGKLSQTRLSEEFIKYTSPEVQEVFFKDLITKNNQRAIEERDQEIEDFGKTLD